MAIQATEVDPEYADAYAWVGGMILTRGAIWWEGRGQSVSRDALNYFEKALKLDQNNAFAHAGMGFINTYQKWNYVEAEKEIFKWEEILFQTTSTLKGQ